MGTWHNQQEECALTFGLPQMTFCPKVLLDVSQLRNYYLQEALEDVVQKNSPEKYGFPMALYVDAVDKEGTFRTDESLDYSSCVSRTKPKRFAYVDTLLLYNLQKICAKRPGDACASLLSSVEKRRALNPLQRWDNINYGRQVTNWWE